jgi:OFA family oxalate/formate antiporter-like MFS transporter
MTIDEMLKSSAFWLFFAWGVLLLIAVYAVMGNVKQCVLELDESATLIATFSVTLLNLCNGFGRLFLGSLYDRLGRTKAMTLDTSLIIVSSILMIAAFQVRSVPLMLLGVVFTGVAYGGVPPTSSAFTVDFFGARNYSMKFGTVNLFIFIGAFGSSLAGIIKDRAGSFRNVFYVLILLGIVALILNLLIKKKRLND